MILLQPQPATSRRAQPNITVLFFFLVILAVFQTVSAQNDNAAATTGTDTDTATTTADSTTSSTSISVPVVTVPPTDGAPYMQTSSTPEGAVFIAVGAVLGFLGLAVLAWRGLVAWSVNRSVRQSAMMQSSETKGLLRSSRRKRYGPRSKEYSFPSVSGKSGGGAAAHPPPHGGNRNRSRSHRRSGSGSGSGGGSQKPIYIVPRSNSGLFYSPTAESRRRDRDYPPPPPPPPHSSAPYPSPYPPAQARHQHQGSHGTPPTEYLDGLFDSHSHGHGHGHSPRRPQRPPEGYNRRRG